MATARKLRFDILGPVRAIRGDEEIDLGPPRQLAVVSLLLLSRGRLVSRDALVDSLWGDDPPWSAANVVHHYIAALRARLEPGRPARSPGSVVVSAGAGYRIPLEGCELDASVFSQLVAEARGLREAGDLAGALRSHDLAQELWRGEPLSGAAAAFVAAERCRLTDSWLAAGEARAEVLLALGRHGDVAADLPTLVARYPLRERLCGLQMLALYRCARQAEALALFAQTRRILADDLGIDPGPGLRRLHEQILTADPALSGPRAATAGTVRLTMRPDGGHAVAVPAGQVADADRDDIRPLSPAQLHHDVLGFTGRDDELASLHAFAAREHSEASQRRVLICAIVGAAGIGKTALATHFAHRVVGQFGDGQLWVDLHGFDPREPAVDAQDALAVLLRGLGAESAQIPRGLEERAARYRSMLASRRMLIILDNAVNASQVRPLLPGYPGCLVLITSRNRLSSLVARDGAVRISLGPLAHDAATSLLERVAGADRVAAEPGAASKIAELCGWLPLALRIAAERIVARPSVLLAGLAAELASDHGRLDALADDQGSKAVRSAFSWSYRALQRDEARMFWLLGLHAGPSVGVMAAAALAGTSQADAKRLLHALTVGHLLEESADGRYHLHDLLRLYAAECASADQNRSARSYGLRRVLDWYLHTADAADRTLAHRHRRVPLGSPAPGCTPHGFTSHRQAVDWYDTERPNLLAACRQAAEEGEHAIAWKLAISLVGLFRLQGDQGAWLETHQIGLAAARNASDRCGEALILGSLGVVYREVRRYDDAIRCHERALAIWAELGDAQGKGGILNNLGNAHWDRRRFQEALDCYHQALHVWRGIGDRFGEGIALNNIGVANRDLLRFRQAFSYLRQALAVRKAIPDHYGEAHTLADLGLTCRLANRHAEAIGYLRSAVAVRRKISDRRGMAQALADLAEVQSDVGKVSSARESLEEAYSIFKDIGGPQLADVRERLEVLDPARPAQVSSST